MTVHGPHLTAAQRWVMNTPVAKAQMQAEILIQVLCRHPKCHRISDRAGWLNTREGCGQLWSRQS